MERRARPKARQELWQLAIAAALLACGGNSSSASSPLTSQPQLEDAELRDVFFLDGERGWAVGDRGAIWHTEDGGRHWYPQQSPLACRWNSVCFVDELRGWIAGGWTRPYLHHGAGVVLRTSDGGQRWEVIDRAQLPGLYRICFLDARLGWAAGQASSLYPAGVFRTEDGGLSWSSVPGVGGEGWTTGDWLDGAFGAVAGHRGTAASLRPEGLQPAAFPSLGLRGAICLRVSGPSASDRSLAFQGLSAAWLVGDGGLVLCSADGGRTWQFPTGAIPAGSDAFDYRTLAIAGGHCWIAGNPGNRVLHTPDGGRTWSVFDTGQSLPLRALHFVDQNRGWAVGSLGTILATRDGGRSWSPQHRGGRRAAMLAIFAEPERVPLEVLAQLCGDEGYLGAVAVLGTRRGTAPQESITPLEDRFQEATAVLGVAFAETAWQFPLRHPSLHASVRTVLDDWNVWHAGQAEEFLEQHLVTTIRTWRPDVILTECPSPRGEDALGQLVSQAVLSAVERSADAADSVDPAGAGLEPWQVKKVISSLGGDVAGTINLTTTRLAPRLGGSPAEQARAGWRLLRQRSQPTPQTYGFRLLVSRLQEGVAEREIFSGIAATAGSENRRPLQAPPPQDLRSLSRLGQQRRNVERLLGYLVEGDTETGAWLSQVGMLVDGVDSAASGEILFELAWSLHDSGRADLAAEVLDYLLRRDPQHELGDAALVWLLQYHASSEAAWAFGRQPVLPAARGTLAAGEEARAAPSTFGRDDRVVAAGWNGASPEHGLALAVHQESAPAATAATRAARAGHYAGLIQHTRPALLWEPAVRFPLTHARRVGGQAREAESAFQQIVSARPKDSWWACARSELWLLDPRGTAPKPQFRCLPSDDRPLLDGRLDDQLWANCLPLSLTSAGHDDVSWPAAVMLACDKEFLYFAADCQKRPETAYSLAAGNRVRDAALDRSDRIDLLIDVDRDCTTYYRLTVDHRGWARDACLESIAWNPKWYIAAAETQTAWSVEAAIPWSELAAEPPSAGDCWAVGIQRVVPPGGYQSWSAAASPEITPASFGLVLFDR